jgi:hypothetical protein
MFSFVNGFLCTCSCDVAKARRGVDPHPKPDNAQSPTKQASKEATVTNANEAVSFGGSLAATATATPATSANVVTAASASPGSAQTDAQGRNWSVNLLV